MGAPNRATAANHFLFVRAQPPKFGPSERSRPVISCANVRCEGIVLTASRRLTTLEAFGYFFPKPGYWEKKPKTLRAMEEPRQVEDCMNGVPITVRCERSGFNRDAFRLSEELQQLTGLRRLRLRTWGAQDREVRHLDEMIRERLLKLNAA